MRFLPYDQASSVPNVIVDGAATVQTVLTLSHWPKSGTPAALKADTSAEIVFNYLDAPRWHVQAGAVSNNHFDEDGLIGIFAMIDPVTADRHRALLIDAARAGDFGVYTIRDAARIAFVIATLAEREASAGSNDPAYSSYVALLQLLPRLLTHLEDYRADWENEDARLATTEAALEKRLITIEERPGLDLAVVRIQDDVSEYHPAAIHSRTACTRLVVIHGKSVDVQYRYEGWVQLASRKPAARVDLSSLARELNAEEQTKGRWIFDGVDRITPRLHLEGSSQTSISPEAVVSRIEHHLRNGQPAWNPYDI